MAIGKKAKYFVEELSRELSETNPLLLAAERGSLTRADLALYLHNLRYAFSQSTSYLSSTRDRAAELGLAELAEYMDGKIPEEAGHAQWAEADLNALGDPSSDSLEVTAETRQLVDLVRGMIREDPRGFLAYQFFAEYFTVLLAPKLLGDLQRHMGIGRSQMSAISNHEETDRHHVAEDLEAVEKFIRGPEQESRFLDDIERTADAISRCLASYVRNPSLSSR